MKFISGGGRRASSSRRPAHSAQHARSSSEYRQPARSAAEQPAEYAATQRVNRSRAYSESAPRTRTAQGHSIPAVDLSALRQSDLPRVVHANEVAAPRSDARIGQTGAIPRQNSTAAAYRQPVQARQPRAAEAVPVYQAPVRRAPAYEPVDEDTGISYNSYNNYEDEAPRPYEVSDRHRRQQKKSRAKRRIITISSILVALAALYCLAVFSNIPLIAKWRTIYIETALMTRSHQWLATAFIPKSVVDKTRATIDNLEKDQENMESDWSDARPISTTTLPAITRPGTTSSETELNPGEPIVDVAAEDLPFWKNPESEFCLTYSELDMDSFAAYAEAHEDEMFDENGNLFIDEAGLDQEGTSIMTVHGDQVLALDTIHGITLIRLEGDTEAGHYRGVLAIVKDPSTVGVAVAKRLGVVGQKIGSMAEDNDAILAINASGFEDPDGLGNGGIVYGMLYAAGEKYKGTDGGTYKAGYFDYDNRLHVGTWKNTKDIRDGVEFKPLLVVNGEQAITGSAGWGIHPRTAIGQTEDGSVIMLVIDGRQPTYSMGVTVGYTAELMLKYGCVQALNLDGGSSSIMYFNGRKITKPSGGDKVNGRYIPDAFVVYANRKATDGLTRPE